ncbi:MAG: ribosome-binding factor A [Arcticibacterium sp.]|jgi:ribosome-binding factor A
MENKRQKQIAKQIQKDLGEIFQKDLKAVIGKAFVTITDVQTTPDLAIARIYLSFMMVDDKDALLEKIKDQGKKIRGLFGTRVRNQFRIVPNFQYYIDETAQEAQKMDDLIASLDIPKEETEIDEDLYPN